MNTPGSTVFARQNAASGASPAIPETGIAGDDGVFNFVPVDLFARSRLRRQVCRIEVEAFGWPRLLFGAWPTITRPYKYLTAAYLADPASRDAKLVGYCLTLRKKTNQGEAAHYIESVGVKPDYRRRGIGRELVRCACAGNDLTWLHVRQSNTAAIALYERLGFVRRQVGWGFYKNNGENAFIMVLEGSCR